jgi:hypothetical protein
MLTFSHPGSRIQGSKRYPIPDPGSRIRIRNTALRRADFHYTVDKQVLWIRMGFNAAPDPH